MSNVKIPMREITLAVITRPGGDKHYVGLRKDHRGRLITWIVGAVTVLAAVIWLKGGF